MSGRGGLEVRGLRKSYRRRPVIRDVSLRLDPGEVVALLGPNGSGKTTCFYAIAGLVAAEAGQVLIDGQDVTGLPMYRRARLGLGYLPQEMSIFRGLTVEENVLAILELSEPSSARRARLEELLSEFGLTHLRRAPALALSGGERRRVEIARCLAARPAYVLLDEPFAGVDPIAVGEIRALVEGLKGRGIGVLITDHNVRETLGLVDRAYILHDGRVLMSGTVAEVVRDEAVRRVYLGQGFGAPLDPQRGTGLNVVPGGRAP
jgi:lipopolysaccharide export system ATP-binding protein